MVLSNGSSIDLRDDAGTQKAFYRGTHRLTSPEQTVARWRKLMPVMGITRLANITGLDIIGVPVVVAVRPNARSLAVSSGKGLSLDAAFASGLMEAIEAYHAERIIAPLLLASYNELRHSHPLIDIAGLPHHKLNRYHDNLQLLWIEGWDLVGDSPCWVPYELVHGNYTLPLPSGCGCFLMSSNGLASGNHLLEAIGHGICEVIERDAAALWLQRDPETRRARRVDIDTIDDPGCRAVLDRFAAADMAVGLWDISTDISLPAFICSIVTRDERDIFRQLYTSGGLGCHPTPTIAALRAMTEAAQTRLVYISGSRDDCDRNRYEQLRNPEAIRAAQRLMLDSSGPRLDFRILSGHEHASFAEQVRFQLDRMRAVGIRQVVAVDLTRHGFDVPVVRIVIPGLEGIAEVPGYTPGARARAVRAQRAAG